MLWRGSPVAMVRSPSSALTEADVLVVLPALLEGNPNACLFAKLKLVLNSINEA